MTTIIYKGGSLWADSRAYSGDKHPIGSKKKLHHIDGKGIVGISSTEIGHPQLLIDHLGAKGVNEPLEAEVKCTALFVSLDRRVYYFCNGPLWSELDDPKHIAIGSGEAYALGALEAGLGAHEALQVACKCDPWSDGEIATVTINA